MTRPYVVSQEHRFVYFIVPKVACTSIKTALTPLFDLDASEEALIREDSRVDGIPREVHRFFRARHHSINKRRLLRGLQRGHYDGYFKFAFVRNPWDRLLSCYLQKIAPGGQGLGRYDYGSIQLRYGMPFPEFVEAVHQISDEEADRHFRSQHTTVCGPDDKIMADFVGRFENLEEDFAHVVGKIGASHLELPHLLPSKARGARSYRDFYDDETAERIGERFRKDAEIFGFSF
jgi:chondroitin 4-sulfotransferase 11